MNKLPYIYSMDYYTAGKRYEPLIHAAAGMKYKIIMLSEIQKKKNIYCMTSFTYNFLKMVANL